MQLLILELVNVSISIGLSTAHVIRIVLEGDGAMIPGAGVPRRHKTVLLLALVVRGGALVVRVISGQTPVTNLPQWAVVFVVVWGLLVTVKTVREWSGGFLALTLMSGEVANVALWNCTTFPTVSTFTFAPFICGTLCGVNAGDKVRGRGWGAIRKKVVLDPGPSPSMYQVAFDQEQLPIRFTFLVVQLYPLSFHVLFLGNLRMQSVDVSHNPRIDNRDEGVVDEATVN
jgi:hypothetical protein